MKSDGPGFFGWLFIIGDVLIARPFEAVRDIVEYLTRPKDTTTEELHAQALKRVTSLQKHPLAKTDPYHPINVTNSLIRGLEKIYPDVDGYVFENIGHTCEQLLVNEDLLKVPVPKPAADIVEQAKYRDELRASIQKHDDFITTMKILTDVLLEISINYINALPPLINTKNQDFPTSIALKDTIENPQHIITQILHPFYDPQARNRNLFKDLREEVDKNLAKAKNVLPEDAEGTLDELIDTYLRNTPLTKLFETKVPFGIPDSVRPEHCLVVASSGTGKTQLLQNDIWAQLQKPNPPGMVVIDSQGQMLAKIEQLAVWNETLKDRLVIIDPADPVSPALNMFALPKRMEGYDRNTRETIEASTLQLFNFIFAALSQELTGRQATAFSFVTRLMLSIPGATLRTLRELLEDSAKAVEKSPFRNHIEKLDDDSRSFFINQYFTPQFAPTRQQVVARLYGMLRVPAFARMFGSTENRLDLFQALQDGKTVLFNTSKSLLGSDASSLFGRYCIALALRAAFERVATPEPYPLALLYVDEAADYFSDGTFAELLTQARKYNLGATICFQNLSQLPTNLHAVVIANTSTKLVAGLSHSDARFLQNEMREPAEWLLSLKKTANASEFGCYIRNHTPHAVRLSIPFGVLEGAPKMTKEAHKAMREVNRERLGVRVEAEQTVDTPAPTAARDPDSDSLTKTSRDW